MELSEEKLDSFLQAKTYLFFLLFATFLVFNISELSNPPYWDEITGLHNQAIFLAKSNFNFADLYQPSQSFKNGGSCIYPIGVLPLVYGVMYWGLPPLWVHVIGHLINIASLAFGGVLFLSLLRKFCSPMLTMLWGLVGLTEPIITGRMASQCQEAVLTAMVMFSLYAFFNDKIRQAIIIALLTCFIKATGVLLAVAYLVYFIYSAIVEKPDSRKKYLKLSLATGVGILACALLYKYTLFPQPSDRSGILYLGVEIVKSHIINFYPWIMLKLLLASIAFGIICFKKKKDFIIGNKYLILPIFIYGFFVAYFLYTEPQIPRYSAMILLPLTLMLAYGMKFLNEKYLQFIAICFFIIHMLNQNGALLPDLHPLYAADPSQLERSREFLKVIEIDRKMAADLEKNAPEIKLICKWPHVQILTMPELRYVKNSLPNIYSYGIYPRYAKATMLAFKEFDRTYSCLFAPNSAGLLVPPLFLPSSTSMIQYIDDISFKRAGVVIFTPPEFEVSGE